MRNRIAGMTGIILNTGRICGPVLAVFLALCCVSCSTTDLMQELTGNVQSMDSETIAAECYDIANAYYDLKKYDKAIVYYEKVMTYMGYENNTVIYNLARSYAMQNNWEDAEYWYSELFDQDINNVTIGMAYAYVLAKQGKLMEARALYQGFYQRNNVDKNLLANYILVLLELGEKEDALEYLEELKALEPDAREISTIEKKIEEMEAESQSEEAETES